jgi:hypothetical protein
MLEVQKYLENHTLDDLTAEFAIRQTHHDRLPLVILNYHQTDSRPKTHPIVRECRALVLNRETNELVARSFNRFFNWGEVREEMEQFDFSSFSVQTKEDGSLVLIFNFQGEWIITTRASFAQDELNYSGRTWEQHILDAVAMTERKHLGLILDKRLTHVCEFCSPRNKIVRKYEFSFLSLLTAFSGERELSHSECNFHAQNSLYLKRPSRFDFTSMGEVQEHIRSQSEADPTYEGVVLRDANNQRWKVKSPTYLGLHRLRGDGGALDHPKNLVPFVLAGDADELLTYFPEAESSYRKCESRVSEAYADLMEVWCESQEIHVQKDYALAIKDRTPFAGLLFQLRKVHGPSQPKEALEQLWKESGDVIVKVLFKGRGL